MRTCLEKLDDDALWWRVEVRAAVRQWPLLKRWISTVWPSAAGVTEPKKRATEPRRLMCVLTCTWEYTVMIGLTMSGRSVISTRNCVLIGSESSGKKNWPEAFVTCGLL